MSDPPSYYSGIEKSPLLGPSPPAPSISLPSTAYAPSTTTVIYQDSSSSSSAGKKCCGVSMAVCLFLCLCCFCVLVVLGGIFGAWAARCSSLEEYRTESHTGIFGESEASTTIQCNGDISLTTSLILPVSIQTQTSISAPDNSSAQAIPFDYTSTTTEFSLEFHWDFWNCPKEDIDITMLDFLNTGTPYSLELTSISGNIEVGAFTLLTFEDAELVAYNGWILSKGIKASDTLKAFAVNGDITLENAVAQKLDLTTSNAAITLNSVSALEFDVSTTNGAISSSTLVVTSQNAKCEVELRTTNAAITIDLMNLPTTVTCDIHLSTTNGEVVLIMRNFAGLFNIMTTNGLVTFTGASCSGSRCNGSVSGSVSHTLYIQTTNANVDVELVN